MDFKTWWNFRRRNFGSVTYGIAPDPPVAEKEAEQAWDYQQILIDALNRMLDSRWISVDDLLPRDEKFVDVYRQRAQS